MDVFIIVIRRDQKVLMKIKKMLDKYIKLSPYYQSKIGYDTLFQNVIPKDILNLIGSAIVDIHMELKMKTSRIK